MSCSTIACAAMRGQFATLVVGAGGVVAFLNDMLLPGVAGARLCDNALAAGLEQACWVSLSRMAANRVGRVALGGARGGCHRARPGDVRAGHPVGRPTVSGAGRTRVAATSACRGVRRSVCSPSLARARARGSPLYWDGPRPCRALRGGAMAPPVLKFACNEGALGPHVWRCPLRAQVARPDLAPPFGFGGVVGLLRHCFPRAAWPAEPLARLRAFAGSMRRTAHCS